MKKMLSVILACILVFAVTIPCFSLDSRKAVRAVDPFEECPRAETTVQVGTWPQTQITEEAELLSLAYLLESADLCWTDDVLANGDHIVYTDVADETARYRVLRTDEDETLWFRWEPLYWNLMNYHGYNVWVCTSVVFAVENNADVFRLWLSDIFYRTAFTPEEQNSWIVGAPTYGITQNTTASVGAYARLFGANGRKYYQRVLPAQFGSDGNYSMTPITSSRVGVRPIITQAFAHTHVTIPQASRGASWIRCLLCWLFH